MKKSRIKLFFLVFVFAVGFLLGSSGLKEHSRLVNEFAECDRYPYVMEKYEQSDRYRCYVKQIILVTKKLGPKEAIAMIDNYRELDQQNSISEARCHNLGHHVGTVAAKSGYSQETIIKECGSSCVGGCLNGAVHHYLFRGDPISELENFCSIPQNDTALTYTCYHGIGHALVEYTMIDLVASMKQCSLISSPEGREQCGHAVAMDYSVSALAPNPRLPRNVAEFCHNQDSMIKASCFEFAGFIEYSRSVDIESAFSVCRQVELSYQATCQRRIAEAAVQRYENKLNLLIDECSKGNEEEFYNCAIHTVQVFRNSVTQDNTFKPEEVCQKLPSKRYLECMSEIADISDSFSIGFEK